MRRFLLFFIFFLFFLIVDDTTYGFSIRTNPPLQLSGFSCSCSLSECTCKQGTAEVGVWLNLNLDFDRYLTGPQKACQEWCLAYVGEPVTAKLPISTDIAETAQASASKTIKKTMTLTEKAALTAQSVLEGLGVTGGADEGMAVVREKALTQMKQQSENMKIDQTVYLLQDMTRTFLGIPKEERIPLDVTLEIASTINQMNAKGKLPLLLETYFLMKTDLKPSDDPFLNAVYWLGLDTVLLPEDKIPEEVKTRQNLYRDIINLNDKPVLDIFTTLYSKYQFNLLYGVVWEYVKAYNNGVKTVKASELVRFPYVNPEDVRKLIDAGFLSTEKLKGIKFQAEDDLKDTIKKQKEPTKEEITTAIKQHQQSMVTEQKQKSSLKPSLLLVIPLLGIVAVVVFFLKKKKKKNKKIKISSNT